ncbi:hypothetical protein AAF712_005646 [Marasmius tenuissimus]|uniref:Uncharacterized protein n=1 Tax=Marasmius tenuissimus TaxID=585030 RepID=A0ABR3A241_9AGAR
MSAKPPGRRTIGGGTAASEGAFMPFDPDTYAATLREKMNDVKDAISTKSKFGPMIATDLATFLTHPIMAAELAANDKALIMFRGVVDYVLLVSAELPAFSLPANFDKVQSFATHVQKLANNLEKEQEKAEKEKEKASIISRKRRTRSNPKSPATVEDDDVSDGDLIDLQSDSKMVDGGNVEGLQASIHAVPDIEIVAGPKKSSNIRGATVSLPYAAIPGICTESNAYSKAIYYISKARGKLPAFKKTRIEPAFSNLQAESPAEALERITEGQQVDRFASLVPFLNLEALEAPTYLSIANFLKSELNTLAHATKYYSGQYSFVQKQLEEVNRIHLSKMGLNGNASEAVVYPASEATASSSNASAA